MLALLLAIAISTSTPLPHVEVCEINETPTIKQVILYRWMWLPTGRSHHVSQWWIIHNEPLVQRRNGMWLVASEGRLFTARSLRRTTTPHDPELRDRDKLHEESRRVYIDN